MQIKRFRIALVKIYRFIYHTMSAKPLTISIGTDHAGFPLKAPIIAFLKQRGHTLIDFGCDSD